MRAWLAIGLWAVTAPARAHDAPAQVTVQMHLRAEGGAMRVLIRVPLEAVRDVDFPAITGGYLDVESLAPRLPGLAKTWVADPVTLYENGTPTVRPSIQATQISLESDRSFATFDSAAARLRAPLPASSENLFWKQVYFDVDLAFPIHDAGANFSIRPAYADLGERVNTVFHYNGRTLLIPGDQERFPLEPGWWQAAWLFLRMGFVHILEGADHLLFLFCLVLPFRRVRPLIVVITAFTAAHSVTLIASALDMAPGALWFPPLVEFGIALSIAAMALANILGWGGRHSWELAFGFGLVHGFGFSFALKESLQFAGSHLAAALLAFNIGVELGQLAALAVLVPLLAALFRAGLPERAGGIVLSALVAHTAWHWMWERGERLRQYPFTAPEMTAANGALALRWVMAALLLYAAAAALRRWRMRE